MQPTIAQHIETTPGICDGKPRIAGHRIRVQDIVTWHESEGFSPDEIVSRFPQITLADVYSALAYYHDHREEIRRHIKEDEQYITAQKATHTSKLVQKLTGKQIDGDSVSSG